MLVHNNGCVGEVGRKGAFKNAKRDAGISRSQKPYKVEYDYMTTAQHEGNKVILGKNGKPIKTREYYFINDKGEKIIIQDHSAGHAKGNQGPHFNVRPINNKRTGKVNGTKEHYSYNK